MTYALKVYSYVGAASGSVVVRAEASATLSGLHVAGM